MTNKTSGYPGNPPAPRLPATQVTTSAYMYKDCYEVIELFFLGIESSKEIIQIVDQFLQNWKTEYTVIYGQCYTYSIPSDIHHLGIRKILFNLKRSSIIYLHHPGQFSNSDSASKKVVGKLGQEIKIDLTYSVS